LGPFTFTRGTLFSSRCLTAVSTLVLFYNNRVHAEFLAITQLAPRDIPESPLLVTFPPSRSFYPLHIHLFPCSRQIHPRDPHDTCRGKLGGLTCIPPSSLSRPSARAGNGSPFFFLCKFFPTAAVLETFGSRYTIPKSFQRPLPISSTLRVGPSLTLVPFFFPPCPTSPFHYSVQMRSF